MSNHLILDEFPRLYQEATSQEASVHQPIQYRLQIFFPEPHFIYITKQNTQKSLNILDSTAFKSNAITIIGIANAENRELQPLLISSETTLGETPIKKWPGVRARSLSSFNGVNGR